MEQIATIAGIVISVVLATVHLLLPVLVCGAALIALAGFLVIAMRETGFTPVPAAEREGWRTMISTTGAGLAAIRGKPVLVTLMAAIFVWGAFSEGYDRLWTLHILENFDLGAMDRFEMVIWFGVIGIVAKIVGLGVTEYVRRRVDTADPVAIAGALMRSSSVLMVALVVFALAGSFWLALVTVWVIGAMRGITYPLREAWINQGLNPKVRATVLSMSGQMDAIGQIAGGPGIGFIGQQLGVRVALALGGLILAPVLPLYRRTIRQNGRLSGAF